MFLRCIGALGALFALLSNTVAIAANAPPPDIYVNHVHVLTVPTPTASSLTQVAGGTLPATTYYVRVTYTSANGETVGSLEQSLSVSANNVLVVTVPVFPMLAITGANVYVTTTSGSYGTALQASAITSGAPWTEPTSGLLSGAAIPVSSTASGSVIGGLLATSVAPVSATAPITVSGVSGGTQTVGLTTPLAITYGGTGSTAGPQYNVVAYGAKCNGSADDTAAIQNAINAAGAAASPTYIADVIIPGQCIVSATLTDPYSNLIITGSGSGELGEGVQPTSALIWRGATNGTILEIAPTGIYPVVDSGVDRISFQSYNGIASYGLQLKAVQFSRFYGLGFDNFNACALDMQGLDSVTGAGTNGDTLLNHFLNIHTYNGVGDTGNSGSGICLATGGQTTYDSSQNTFENTFVENYNGPAYELQYSDVNTFRKAMTYRIPGGTGLGVEFNCSSYSNTFYWLSPSGGGTTAQGTALCGTAVSHDNRILGYDIGDSNSPVPVIEPGASLLWKTDQGSVFAQGAKGGAYLVNSLGSSGLVNNTTGYPANNYQWACGAGSTVCDFGANGTATVAGVTGAVLTLNNGTNTSAGAYLAVGTSGSLGIGGSFNGAGAVLTGTISQPAYAQHGILSVTTPATCTALSACASGSVTFTTAMNAATYECTANTETYPYVVEISAKTTTTVTFELYNLVAVATAQTVPVDYDCKV